MCLTIIISQTNLPHFTRPSKLKGLLSIFSTPCPLLILIWPISLFCQFMNHILVGLVGFSLPVTFPFTVLYTFTAELSSAHNNHLFWQIIKSAKAWSPCGRACHQKSELSTELHFDCVLLF